MSWIVLRSRLISEILYQKYREIALFKFDFKTSGGVYFQRDEKWTNPVFRTVGVQITDSENSFRFLQQ